MILLFLFIAVPILEIGLFIQVGGAIGLWATLGCVVLTALVGTALLRHQGLQVLRQAQSSMEQNRVPVESVMHGAFLLAAGLLLLTPGFFTDAVGFVLLVPPLRLFVARTVWRRLKENVTVHRSAGSGGPSQRSHRDGGVVIDGEAVEVKPDKDDGTEAKPVAPPADGRSPWRQ